MHRLIALAKLLNDPCLKEYVHATPAGVNIDSGVLAAAAVVRLGREGVYRVEAFS